MRLLAIVLMVGFLSPSQAYSQISFEAIAHGAASDPPNNSPILAFGRFSLTDRIIIPQVGVFANVFNCFVYFPFENFESNAVWPNSASIRNVSGDIITNQWGFFNLGIEAFGAPDSPLIYKGQFVLSEEQVRDLLAGKWYVDIACVNVFGISLPDSEVRGKIASITSPSFILQPASTNVVKNASEVVILDSLSTGIHNVAYQWKFYRTSSSTITDITGATNSSFTITNVQLQNAGNYFVVASGLPSSATSSVAKVFVWEGLMAQLNSIGFSSTSFWFQISGLTNRPYRVEATEFLEAPVVWKPIFTNRAPYFYTNYPREDFPTRFFRVIANIDFLRVSSARMLKTTNARPTLKMSSRNNTSRYRMIWAGRNFMVLDSVQRFYRAVTR